MSNYHKGSIIVVDFNSFSDTLQLTEELTVRFLYKESNDSNFNIRWSQERDERFVN